METKYYKTFFGVVKGINEEEHTLDVYVSTPSIDRDNEVIKLDAWDVKEFLKNPVLIDSHNYNTVQNIIGKVLDINSDNKGLATKIKYFVGEGNEKADWAYALAKNGIAAFSVGFIPVKKEQGQGQVRTVYTEVKLLEVSQVPVPANPEAVINNSAYVPVIKTFQSFKEAKNSEMGIKQADGFNSTSIDPYEAGDSNIFNSFYKVKEETEVEQKGVIPFKKHPLADPNAKWDAAKEIKQATEKNLYEMCAWYDKTAPDPNGDGLPDSKLAYKLPHHYVKNYVTVWKGVAAAMAALLGARGGVNIPDKDKKGVYNHLAKHYEEFGKKPPAFKEYGNDEEIFKACGIEEVDTDVGTKSGRVLSEANRKKVQNAIGALKSAQTALEELLKLSETQTNSSPLGESKSEEGKELTEVLEGLKKALSV